MNNRIPGRRDNRGVTLIETIVGMFVLAIVVVPLLYTFVFSIQTNYKSSEKSDAESIAQSIAEAASEYGADNVTFLADYGTVTLVSSEGGIYKYTVEDVASPSGSGQQYTVSVEYDPSSNSTVQSLNDNTFPDVTAFNSKTTLLVDTNPDVQLTKYGSSIFKSGTAGSKYSYSYQDNSYTLTDSDKSGLYTTDNQAAASFVDDTYIGIETLLKNIKNDTSISNALSDAQDTYNANKDNWWDDTVIEAQYKIDAINNLYTNIDSWITYLETDSGHAQAEALVKKNTVRYTFIKLVKEDSVYKVYASCEYRYAIKSFNDFSSGGHTAISNMSAYTEYSDIKGYIDAVYTSMDKAYSPSNDGCVVFSKTIHSGTNDSMEKLEKLYLMYLPLDKTEWTKTDADRIIIDTETAADLDGSDDSKRISLYLVPQEGLMETDASGDVVTTNYISPKLTAGTLSRYPEDSSATRLTCEKTGNETAQDTPNKTTFDSKFKLYTYQGYGVTGGHSSSSAGNLSYTKAGSSDSNKMSATSGGIVDTIDKQNLIYNLTVSVFRSGDTKMTDPITAITRENI